MTNRSTSIVKAAVAATSQIGTVTLEARVMYADLPEQWRTRYISAAAIHDRSSLDA
jgi:hypothetical protein